MTKKTAAPENAISRRHFMLSASLATTAFGFESMTGIAGAAQENPTRANEPGKWCLWSDRPAMEWMTEALPIGNGPMGAMLFGSTEIERIQFNEISLWTGDRMAVEGPGAGRYRGGGSSICCPPCPRHGPQEKSPVSACAAASWWR